MARRTQILRPRESAGDFMLQFLPWERERTGQGHADPGRSGNGWGEASLACGPTRNRHPGARGKEPQPPGPGGWENARESQSQAEVSERVEFEESRCKGQEDRGRAARIAGPECLPTPFRRVRQHTRHPRDPDRERQGTGSVKGRVNPGRRQVAGQGGAENDRGNPRAVGFHGWGFVIHRRIFWSLKSGKQVRNMANTTSQPLV